MKNNIKKVRKVTLLQAIKVAFLCSFMLCIPITIASTISQQKNMESLVVLTGFMAPVKNKINSKVLPFGTASGFVVDDKGYLLTAYDKFYDKKSRIVCQKFTAQFIDGRKVNAKLVAVDAILNLAILKLDSTQKYPALNANTRAIIQADDPVTVITGEGITKTGVIKQKNRGTLYSTGLGDMLINLAIELPDSAQGSPIFDSNGTLIAINTSNLHENLAAVITRSEQHGLPMSIIMTFYKVLIRYPTFELPWLGIAYRNLSIEENNLLRKNNHNAQGIAVDFIWNNSIAADSQLQRGDIIVSIDEQLFPNKYALDKYLYQQGIGAKMQIVYFRDDELLNTSITTTKRASWAAAL